MSASNAAALGGGLIGGAIGFFTGGITGALYGFSIGSTIAGLILGPEQDQQTIKPEELNVPTSTESATLPVIFGTSRLAGNHIAIDRDSFQSKAQTQSAGGKGGGGEEQVTGYKYRLTWQTLLCMGPVDELVKVTGNPGEDNVLWDEETQKVKGTFDITVANDRITGTAGDFSKVNVGNELYVVSTQDLQNNGARGIVIAKAGDSSWVELTAGTFQGSDESGSDLIMEATEVQSSIPFGGSEIVTSLEGKSKDKGEITIYPGNSTQVGKTIEGRTYNYRQVCYVHYENYQMGEQPSPRSYIYEMRRFPVCVDSMGAVLPGINTRGSNTVTDDEYNDANPAAVLFEVLTNKIWGKGMSPDLIYVPDFELASAYYAEKRIGFSTSMAGETGLKSLVEKLKAVFGLAVWWEGDLLRCRVVWDRDNAYTPRTRIDAEDIVDTPVISRPTIVTSVNELRLDFTNRINNYQKETVTVQDLGSIEELDAIRQERINGTEIGTRRAAELLGHRILRELAYQPAQCSLKVHRTFANRGIGEFIELYWEAWREGGGFTTFWRLEGINDAESDENVVTLTLVEDLYATARDGEIADFTAPIISIDVDNPLTDDDFGGIDYTTNLALGEITPVLIEEPNIWLSKGIRSIVTACQKRNGGIQTITLGFAEAATLDYQTLGVLRPFAITGTLLDPITADGPKMIRESADQFRIQLSDEERDAADLLSAASLVTAPGDHFSDLTSRAQNIMVINGEVWRIGTIEETGVNEYTVRSAMRAEFGSIPEAHLASDTFWFFEEYNTVDYAVAANAVPTGTPLKFRLQPTAASGSGDPTVVDGPDALGIDGASTKPQIASCRTAERAGLDWTIKIRPVVYWAGAGFGPGLESEVLEELDNIDPLRLRIARSDGASVTIADYFTAGSEIDGDLEVTRCEWIPAQRGDPESGQIIIELTMTGSNPANVNIYQRIDGQESDALVIPQPA